MLPSSLRLSLNKSFLAAAALGLAATAQAATLFWDGADTTANADGGAGTWNTASTNWDNAATGGANATWSNATPDSAVFGGAAGTVTLGTTITAGGMTFNTTGYTVTGSTLTLNGATISTASGVTATIASQIASSGLTIGGAGTVVFNSQKTYTGGTTISSGATLDLTSGGGSAGVIRGTATVNSGGTLRWSTGDASGYNGGASALTTINLIGGTLNINSTSNQTLGSTVINMTGGAITGVAGANLDFFGGASALNTLASGTTSTISGTQIRLRQNNGATFNVADGAAAIDLQVDSVVASASGFSNNFLVKTGAGTMVLNGANTYSTGTTISAGTLQIGNGGTSGTIGTGAVTNNATLAFNRSDAITVSNVISGTGSLVKNGSGTLTLSGANAYSGGTTINAGTVTVSAANNLGTGAITVNAGGILDFNHASGTQTVSAAIAGTGSIVKSAAGGLVLTGTNAFSGTYTVNSGDLVFNSAGAEDGAPSVVLNAGRLVLAGSFVGGSATIGNLSGTGGVINTAFASTVGTRTLSVMQTIDGTFAGSMQDASGGRLLGLNKNGGSALILTGASTYTGGTTINAGTLQIGAGGTTGSIAGAVSGAGGVLSFARSGDLDSTAAVAGAIGGDVSIEQAGGGVLTLKGTNAYTGSTRVSSGTLKLDTANSRQGTGEIAIAAGAKFDANNLAVTTTSLNDLNGGGGELAMGTGNLTVNIAAGTASYSGVISSSGGLTKSGAGTQVLSGANTFTDLVVNGGVLRVDSVAALGQGTSTVAITAPGELEFNAAADSSVTRDIAGDGVVVHSGTGKLTVTSALTGVGLRVQAGTGAVTVSNALDVLGAVDNSGTLVFQGDSLTSLNNVTGASATVTATGDAGAVTNAGAMTLNADSLQSLDNQAAGVATVTTINSAGNVTNSGTLTLTAGPVTAVTNSGTLTIAGTQVGAVTNTAGTLNVTAPTVTGLVGISGGASTFIGAVQGDITVSGGSMTLGSGATDTTSQIASANTTVSGTGSIKLVSGATYTVNGLNGDGLLEQAGAATSVVTLDATNAGFTGTVRLTSGVVAIDDATDLGSSDLEFNGGILRILGGVDVTTLGDVTLNAGTLSYLETDGIFTVGGILNNNGGVLLVRGAGSFAPANSNVIQAGGTLNFTTIGLTQLALTDFNDAMDVTTDVAGAFATLTVNQTGADGTASGVISNNVNLVKNGGFTLSLSGANTYLGTTTVNDGSLRIVDGGALGAGDVTVNTGGVLEFSRTAGNDITVANIISGAGSITQSGAGDVTFSGVISGLHAVTQNGAGRITFTGASVAADDLDGAGTGGVTFATGATGDFTALNYAGNVQLDTGSTLKVSSGTFAGSLTGDGAFNKTGVGTLIIAGNNTAYSGTVTIERGTLQLNDGGDLGTGSLINKGVLAFNRSTEAVINASLTGLGGISQLGSGKLTYAANNTYVGRTVIGSGSTLQVGNGGATGTLGGGSVTNDGTLIFNRSNDIAVSNSIIGTGSVVKEGAGTLTFSGNNTYTGDTVVNAGRLILKASTLPRGQIIAQGGTLEFAGTGAGVIAKGISGAGAVDFTGVGGSTALLGDGAHTGVMTVKSGHTLKLGASGAPITLGSSNLVVDSGATLSGFATIAGSLSSKGVVSPGASPGTITVGGDFISTGTLNMEIAGTAAGSHDLIEFGGVATLGGTLNITFLNGYTPQAGDSVTLLRDTDTTNNGGVSFNGNFIFVNLPAGAGRLVTSANAIAFLSGTSLAQSASLSLHDGVAAYTDALSASAAVSHPRLADFIAVRSASGDAALARALQNASPVGLASLTSLPVTQAGREADELRRRAESRAQVLYSPYGDVSDWGAWVGGNGGLMDHDDGASSPSFDTRSFGGAAGIERVLGDGGLSLGVRVGYDRGSADLHDGGGKTDQDHARVTVYASFLLGEAGYLSASAGMGYSSYETRRNTLGGGVEKASPTGWDLAASIDGGYVFRLNREWTLTPHAGLSVVSAQVSGFTERGSDLALAVDSYTQTAVRTRLGTGIHREWKADNAPRAAVRLGLDVAYEHTLFGDTVDIPATFATFPQSGGFKSESPAVIKDSLVVGPQLEWALSDTAGIGAGYRLEWGFDGSIGHRADIAFTQRF